MWLICTTVEIHLHAEDHVLLFTLLHILEIFLSQYGCVKSVHTDKEYNL